MFRNRSIFADEIEKFLHLIGAKRKDVTDRFNKPGRNTMRKFLDGELETGVYIPELARRLQVLLDETRRWIDEQEQQFGAALEACNVSFIQLASASSIAGSQVSGNGRLIVDTARLCTLRPQSREEQLKRFYRQVSLARARASESPREMRNRNEGGGEPYYVRSAFVRVPSAITRLAKQNTLTSTQEGSLAKILQTTVEDVLHSIGEKRRFLEKALCNGNCAFLDCREARIEINATRLADLFRKPFSQVSFTHRRDFDNTLNNPDPIVKDILESLLEPEDAARIRQPGVTREVVRDSFKKILTPEALARLDQTLMRIYGITEGSTRITIEVPSEDAEWIAEVLRRAERAGAGISDVRVSRADDRESFWRAIGVKNPWVKLGGVGSGDLLAKSWRASVRWEQVVRPWRRLRGLSSRSPETAPSASVIYRSQERAYALPGSLVEHRKAFQADLRIILLAWPGLTVVLILMTLLPLRPIYPFIDLWTGITTGITLGLTGGVVCAAVVSPLAVGAGSIAMGWAFGIAHAFIAGRFGMGSEALGGVGSNHDPFIAVTGGLVGLSAPQWLGALPLPVIVSVLIVVAGSITAAGLLMAQPDRAAANRRDARSVATQIKGAICGSLVGGCIGLVYALTSLFESSGITRWLAFPSAFSLVGGITFSMTVWLKTRDRVRAACFGIAHAIVAFLLCIFAAVAVGPHFSLLALAAATAWYHATWFTGAFIIGDTVGSTKAAVAATTIEGGIGFTSFVLFRMFNG